MNSKPDVCRLLVHSAKRARMRGFFIRLPSILFLLLVCSPIVNADDGPILQNIEYASLPGNIVQITLTASSPLAQPSSFTTDNPARIALDFAGMKSDLARKTLAVDVGGVRSVTAIEAGGRTRVVVNLVDAVDHKLEISGNQVFVTLQGGGGVQAAPSISSNLLVASDASKATGHRIQDIDFRRGDAGEGRVSFTLSDPSTLIDMREEAGNIVLEFLDVELPEKLIRKFDVTDFATPVETFEASPKDGNVYVKIIPKGDYEHLAYQANELYTVEFRPLTKQEKEELRKEKEIYTGERLSLNFQDIEVRAVLQLLADFTGLNMVTSDTVGGSLTLRLKNVPWDQALDIILKTKGLSMRRNDNVVLVAPTEELAAQEKLELESQQQIEELAPLYSQYIQINYAKAVDIAAILAGETSSSGDQEGGEGGEGDSLMSPRGNVTVDERTNTLLVQDTAAKLEDILLLVRRLDIPVRQVLIESRIVTANDDFAKELGVRFGFGSGGHSVGGHEVFVDGGVSGYLDGTHLIDTGSWMDIQGANINNGDNRHLFVNLPANNPSGAVNILVGRLGTYLLQLELSAMQTEGRGEVISSPRVITSDQSEAVITQGFEIPYTSRELDAETGAVTSTTIFKTAVLELKVTPHITPDDRVEMDLGIKKDQPLQASANPIIERRNVITKVSVDNGETVVLGGIYERTRSSSTERVPLFGDLPYVGFLFKSENRIDSNKEILIFVTPKILKDSLALP